jgi:hypothetical protein
MVWRNICAMGGGITSHIVVSSPSWSIRNGENDEASGCDGASHSTVPLWQNAKAFAMQRRRNCPQASDACWDEALAPHQIHANTLIIMNRIRTRLLDRSMCSFEQIV